MDMVESSPTSQVQTGCGTEDAHRLLVKANKDLPRAVQLYELLATETPRGRKIPHLAVGESDRQRAQELLERPLATAALSNRRQSGELSPLADGFLSPQVNTEGRHQSSSTGSRRSRDGTVTENGKHFVLRSVRLNSTIRPEHAVKPGFVPEDDKIPYKNRRV
ncbi:hypothetical protein IFR05_014625 [Cadophora sp. M221]|nr:hypothetical protein IFR05_014625 [Cadophora sp. M221]